MNNSLSETEKKEIQKDPFLMMAIEGYSEQKGSLESYKKFEKKIKHNHLLYWRLGIGFLIFGTITIFLFTINIDSEPIKKVINTVQEEKSIIQSNDVIDSVTDQKEFIIDSSSNVDFIVIKEKQPFTFVSKEKKDKMHVYKDTIQENIQLELTEETNQSQVSEQKQKIKIEGKTKELVEINPINFSIYSISTQKYLMSTYHQGVKQKNRTSTRGQAKSHKFAKYVEEKNYEKAWKMIQKYTQFNIAANEHLPQWIQTIRLIENQNYQEALVLLNTLPILPPVLNNLKINLKKDLEKKLEN